MFEREPFRKKTERRSVAGTESVAKLPPATDFPPIQCAMLEMPQEEWYGNRFATPDRKRRFLRTNLRRAILVPASGTYPHLTIDIDDVNHKQKRRTVTLHISRMHYSKSKTAERIFYAEDPKTGAFVTEQNSPEAEHATQEANAWLRKAKIGFVLQTEASIPALPGTPKVRVSAVTDTDLPKTDSTSSLPLEEGLKLLTVSDSGSGSSISLSPEPSPSMAKKRKKRKKKPDRAALRDFFDEQELEENIKFGNLMERYGVEDLSQLPDGPFDYFLEMETLIVRHISEKITALFQKSRTVGKGYSAETLRQKLGDKAKGKKLPPDQFAKSLTDRMATPVIPNFSEYRMSDLIPDSIRTAGEPTPEQRDLFLYALRVMANVYSILLMHHRAHEIHDNTKTLSAHFTHSASKLSSVFFLKMSANFCPKIDLSWDGSETYSVTSLMENPKSIDAEAYRLEEHWDTVTSDVKEVFDEMTWAINAMYSLPPEAISELDRQAGSISISTQEEVTAAVADKGTPKEAKMERFTIELNKQISMLRQALERTGPQATT
ncbi:hypothetical protein FUAX_39550 (plasmid) [Fulvitalea axinellae]|uniref:Uncharacterized protein n=1 Tax=Fulvitalea axinellae TaxID=1182444 RepID=A0AAU9CTX3_9BACT|nr:hypothetical protein FUAX_39550 [Fulvitalea axinellae]